jgi:FdhE protein
VEIIQYWARVPTPHTDPLWHRATALWAEITSLSPYLSPAVRLQQHLVRLTIDAATELQETALLPLASASILEKWRKGLPALRNEIVPIPCSLKEILGPICTALAEAGAGESAQHIGDAIAAKAIDADSLLGVSLARNQKAIRTSALHMGFSPDLVWLIGELGSAPLAHHLQHHVLGSDPRTGTGARPHDWDRGYCPFCGSWPAFIEAHGANHLLRCSYCALGWSLTSRRCAYCGNAGDDFLEAAPDIDQKQQRLEMCGRCSGYTKVIAVEDPTPFPLLAIADLATMSLDQGAMDRGYRRPELFDLDTIEARTSSC